MVQVVPNWKSLGSDRDCHCPAQSVFQESPCTTA
jgi:hypothetical protein